MKRFLIFLAVLALVGGAFGVQYMDADFARPRIAQALERGLGRRVEVGKAYFNLLTGPGFAIEDVTIHEDPRAGIEPFAYVGRLEARVQLLSLFRRRLEFSSIRLVDASINLVKTEAGPWNYQFLLNSAPASAGMMPAIRMRGGRVNFKFGDTKSVFYFSDADLDVAPHRDGTVDLRFTGAPSRTDRWAQDFGFFSVRGAWGRQRLDLRVELQRSALEEVARLIDRRGFGLHGVIAFDMELSGAPSHLDLMGQIQVDDVHRWDLLPKRGGGYGVPFKGTLDLRGERLEVRSISDTSIPPITFGFRAWDFLSTPHWDATADLKQVPLSTLLEVGRHMGAAFSEKLAAEGSVSGAVRYSEPDGVAGRLELQDASVGLPEAQPLRASSAAVAIEHGALSLEPSTVQIGERESAEVEGSYSLQGANALDLKITTKGLNVADLRSFGLAAIPLLEQTSQGVWRGWARYEWSRGEPGGWTGEYELLNARISVDGLADPLRIHSAAVSLNGKRVAVSRLRATVGDVAFTGDYRWEPAALRPHKFHINIAEADAAELERILAPTLVRERGFLARTLRLGAAPAPEWLLGRRADGTVSIGALTVGDTQMRIDSTRFLWDALQVRLAGLTAHIDQSVATGELTVDLSDRSPHYRFEGKLVDVAYKGGKLDFEGGVEAEGTGADVLASARAEGHLRGRAIAFTPEADFRNVAACFEMNGLRWKLSSVEATQGTETFNGIGATQADGRLVLDLTSRGRQLRYSALVTGLAPQ